MSHINNVELSSRFWKNELYIKALGTKINTLEQKVKFLLSNSSNDSIISVLAGYDNKMEELQNKINILEKKLEEEEQE